MIASLCVYREKYPPKTPDQRIQCGNESIYHQWSAWESEVATASHCRTEDALLPLQAKSFSYSVPYPWNRVLSACDCLTRSVSRSDMTHCFCKEAVLPLWNLHSSSFAMVIVWYGYGASLSLYLACGSEQRTPADPPCTAGGSLFVPAA